MIVSKACKIHSKIPVLEACSIRIRHSSKKANMFFVYVLKSLRNGKKYIGYTSKDPKYRLIEHNNGSNKYTNQNKPFELLYQETLADKTSAIKREKLLKSGQGR